MGVKTRKGKTDYRAWANKYLKPGALPEQVQGWGIGRRRYCPTCKCLAYKTVYKFNDNENCCWCQSCGSKIKEYLPNDYKLLYKWKDKLPQWLWKLLDNWCINRAKKYFG